LLELLGPQSRNSLKRLVKLAVERSISAHEVSHGLSEWDSNSAVAFVSSALAASTKDNLTQSEEFLSAVSLGPIDLSSLIIRNGGGKAYNDLSPDGQAYSTLLVGIISASIISWYRSTPAAASAALLASQGAQLRLAREQAAHLADAALRDEVNVSQSFRELQQISGEIQALRLSLSGPVSVRPGANAPTIYQTIEHGFEFLGEVFGRDAHAEKRDGMRGLIIADIDGFEAINRRFGVRTGERVVDRVFDLIRATPNVMVAGRCGGDAFFLVLSGSSGVDIRITSEELVSGVRDGSWSRIEPALFVTCSAGFAEFEGYPPDTDFVQGCIDACRLGKIDGGSRATSIAKAALVGSATRGSTWEFS